MQLSELLEGMGATLIEGPRGCGKTSTGLQHAHSALRLDSDPQLITLAGLNPRELLRGPTPRLIDEWQLAPELWNVIRHEIDDRRERGQFILSGSATPAEDLSRHSGAGRIGRVRMRPMSLDESEQSSRSVSLALLAETETVVGVGALSYPDLAEQAVRGGWPGLLGASTRQAVIFNRSYVDDLCHTDIPMATGVRHDSVRLRRLLASVARNVSQEATLASLAADVGGDGGATDPGTIRTYLDALTRVFALEELPAWSVALRSRARLRTSPKLHLADPSLACALLGIGPDRLARDPEYFGQVFESMAVRDIRSLASAQAGRVFHYRDSTGLEVDVIIEYPDGRWAPIEVKLGSAQIPQAEASLLRLRDGRVDVARVGKPAFMAVVTGTEYAYTLQSGVHVIPLAALAT